MHKNDEMAAWSGNRVCVEATRIFLQRFKRLFLLVPSLAQRLDEVVPYGMRASDGWPDERFLKDDGDRVAWDAGREVFEERGFQSLPVVRLVQRAHHVAANLLFIYSSVRHRVRIC